VVKKEIKEGGKLKYTSGKERPERLLGTKPKNKLKGEHDMEQKV